MALILNNADERKLLSEIVQEELDYWIEQKAHAEEELHRTLWVHIHNEDRREPQYDEETYMTVRPGAPVNELGDPIDWDDYELTAEGRAQLNRDQQRWDEELEQLEIDAKDAHERESKASAALKELFYLREILSSPPADERRSPALLAWWRARHQ
jgi:hypothetical protein